MNGSYFNENKKLKIIANLYLDDTHAQKLASGVKLLLKQNHRNVHLRGFLISNPNLIGTVFLSEKFSSRVVEAVIKFQLPRFFEGDTYWVLFPRNLTFLLGYFIKGILFNRYLRYPLKNYGFTNKRFSGMHSEGVVKW